MSYTPRETAFGHLRDVAAALRGQGDDRFAAFLEQANLLFGTEFGIVSRIEGEVYEVQHCAGGAGLTPGMRFTLGRTYCSLTLEAGDLVSIHAMGQGPHATHPCYADHALETAHRDPAHGARRAYGTLNFSARAARDEAWSEAECCLVRILASLVEASLEARDLEDRVAGATTSLERTSRALDASNRELERFALVAAHDLQAPLRTVSSFSKLLSERYGDRLDATAQTWLGFMQQASTRMQTLVRDLLSYSRLGAKELAQVEVNLEHCLLRVTHELRDAIARAQAEVTYDPLPSVVGDGDALQVAFLALIHNVLAYAGDAPPRAHVSATRDGARWVVAVADEGLGIEPEFQAEVFEPFRRLHTPEAIPGSGLGLPTVRRVAEAHGGEAWLESHPGRGTTVFLALPAFEG
ncbi:MAG: ATP-binding protein [Planctomycetota bacterium]